MPKSKIEWLKGGSVWNPMTGCTKASSGCKNCYAERMSKRLAGRVGYPAGDPFKVTLHTDKLELPLRWKRPRLVFVCSMGDLFHEDVPFEFIDRVMAVIVDASNYGHTFIVLTKRAERMKAYFGDEKTRRSLIAGWAKGNHKKCATDPKPSKSIYLSAWPIKNLWLGVSAENQDAADERIPLLLQTPAANHIVSVEPMLGPIGFGLMAGHLDWIICGGESGPGARPMHPDWVRSLRDQSKCADVPFFFKQFGGWRSMSTNARWRMYDKEPRG